jgi:hypothetical protein
MFQYRTNFGYIDVDLGFGAATGNMIWCLQFLMHRIGWTVISGLQFEKHLVMVPKIRTRLEQHAGNLCVPVLSRVHHSRRAVIVSRAHICTCENVNRNQKKSLSERARTNTRNGRLMSDTTPIPRLKQKSFTTFPLWPFGRHGYTYPCPKVGCKSGHGHA